VREKLSRPGADACFDSGLPAPQPQISDDVGQWLAPRAAKALHAHGIRTLADLTVRIPRRRRWWAAIDGLGVEVR
jgi:hypothetical protein